MQVLGLTLRDFRGYHDARVELGEGLTVVTGPNGAGKTNLLEGLYFACTGRSCRTSTEREVVKFGAAAARTVLTCQAEDGLHELSVGFSPGQPKVMRADGATVDRLLDVLTRPLVSVFLPDRLELIKGAPALRRAHLDQFVAALWPARSATRRAYGHALAQRNALLTRIRAGRGSRASLTSWDAQLARHGVALMEDRRRALELLAEPVTRLGTELGLAGQPTVSYRPRSRAASAAQLAEELSERIETDLERGFTGHGPHRDDVASEHEGHDLRAYGSQGQQRLALLALLLAEREVIAEHRPAPPLMLLDDVMSELDRERRQALVELLRTSAGQSVITATDLEHVPGGDEEDIAHVAVSGGRLLAMAGQ
jgi:DNA replication and repair protein RecF